MTFSDKEIELLDKALDVYINLTDAILTAGNDYEIAKVVKSNIDIEHNISNIPALREMRKKLRDLPLG